MQINVAQLLKEPIGSSRSSEINDTVNFSGEEITEYHVQGNIDLIRTDRGILVEGTLEGKSSLMCSRCLTSFECPLKFKVEEEFLPSTDIISGISHPLPEDSTTFMIDEHHILDLSETVRQYALLAMPMKPLCRPDCVGLCPNCGANLNQSTCQCTSHIQKSPRYDFIRKVK